MVMAHCVLKTQVIFKNWDDNNSPLGSANECVKINYISQTMFNDLISILKNSPIVVFVIRFVGIYDRYAYVNVFCGLCGRFLNVNLCFRVVKLFKKTFELCEN